MGGYDGNHYMEMALIKPGEVSSDPHFRRSYVAKSVTQQVNKFINLPVLKHHQSAGVTIALKNMSHGLVNNVNRSHLTPTDERLRDLHPAVVSLPVIREKAVLHICDGVKASYHGGPGGKPRHLGAQNDVLRDRPGGYGPDRPESDRRQRAEAGWRLSRFQSPIRPAIF